MAMARQQGHPVALAIAYLGQLFLAAEEGDLDQAQAIADDALTHVTRYHLSNTSYGSASPAPRRSAYRSRPGDGRDA